MPEPSTGTLTFLFTDIEGSGYHPRGVEVADGAVWVAVARRGFE